MKRLAVLGAAVCLALGAGGATNATITRIYAGTVDGSIAMLPMSADAFAEITGTPEAFAAPSGQVFTVRGRFARPPAYLGAEDLTNWSNYIRVHVSNAATFIATASWADGSGKVASEWPVDWSSVTAQAAGEVMAFPVEIERTRLVLIETQTNGASGPGSSVGNSTNGASGPGSNGDAIVLTSWKRYGQHKVHLPAIPVTRELHSAQNLGENVRLSFEPLGWPTKTDPKKGKTTDGGVVILWPEGGGFAGGLFDWHGVGQTTKTQENIHGGYLEGHQPPKGSPVFYCIVNHGFTQRTSIKAGGVW